MDLTDVQFHYLQTICEQLKNTQRAEYALYQEFNDLIGAQTAFFISHRLASTKFFDKIIVIKDKQICEFESHKEERIQCKQYDSTICQTERWARRNGD